MFRYLSALLIAGLCFAGSALAQARSVDAVDQRVTADVDSFRGDTSDEHWRSGDGFGKHEENALKGRTAVAEGKVSPGVIDGPRVAGTSQRIESRTEVRSNTDIDRSSEVVKDAPSTLATDSKDMADRAGPVPFADIGNVGSGDTLATHEAIEQDKELQMRGDISGDELVLHLPAGTLKDTLSLRSSNGLSLSRADVQRMGRFDGDDLRLSLSDIGIKDSGDLGDLWVWGTGDKSASLLQRVAMSGSISRDVAKSGDIPVRRSAAGTSTLGAPVRSDSRIETTPDIYRDRQIDKETDMLRSSGLEKSATDKEQDDF